MIKLVSIAKDQSATEPNHEPTMKSLDGTELLIDLPERRSETREPAKDDYNAEIKMLGYPIYQVKIADISSTGASIVVKEDSSLLDLLTVGREFDVQLHADEPESQARAGRQFKAEVKHISDVSAGRYKGHRVVGIQMVGDE